VQKKEDGAPLPEVQKKIIENIKANPKITYDELAEIIGKDRSTIMRNIKKLKSDGKLKRKGSKKWSLGNRYKVDDHGSFTRLYHR